MHVADIYRMADEFYLAVLIRKNAKAPSAGLLFFCPKDKTVFLTHRSPHMSSPGTWDLPGGRPEDIDKSPMETATREVYEELNTVPKNKNPVKTYTIKTNQHHYIVFLMPLSDKEKEVFTKKISLNNECDRYQWFTYDAIPKNTHFDLSWVRSEISNF